MYKKYLSNTLDNIFQSENARIQDHDKIIGGKKMSYPNWEVTSVSSILNSATGTPLAATLGANMAAGYTTDDVPTYNNKFNKSTSKILMMEILFLYVIYILVHNMYLSLVVGWWMVFNGNFSYIMTVSFIHGGNRSNQRKTTNLSQFTDKLLSHNVVSSTPRLGGIRTHNVSGDRHR